VPFEKLFQNVHGRGGLHKQDTIVPASHRSATRGRTIQSATRR
jgi:hypothetical protein